MVNVGDEAPDFELPDQNGELIKLSSFRDSKNVVLFFYPKDGTPGCTKQACTFRDSLAQFNTLDAEVIGISSGSVSSHKQFAEQNGLTYRLASDGDNKARKAFQVSGNLFGMLPGRVTFVLDKSGVVRHVFNSQMQASKHVDEARQALERIRESERS